MEKYATNKTNVFQSEVVLFEKKNIKFSTFLLVFFILASFGNFCWAHHVEPPVHQWIALQAYLKIADDPGSYADLVSEMQFYLPTDPFDSNYSPTFSPPGGWTNSGTAPYEDSTALIEGTWEEDKEHLDSPKTHFWDPGSGYDAGLSSYRSALQRAQEDLWQAAIFAYDSNKAPAYYRLGRIAHLLMDISVPAHVQLDWHIVDLDNYEYFVGSGDNFRQIESSSSNTSVPDRGNLPAYTRYTPPYYNNNLTNLFYNLGSYADMYDSDDVDGNSVDYGNGKYRKGRHFLNPAKVFSRAEYWDSSSKIRDMVANQDFHIFEGCASVSEYSIFYYPSFYEELVGAQNFVKVFYADESEETLAPAFLDMFHDNVPDSVLECIYQPELQARAIGYVAALYQLFWDETHPDTIGTLSSPGVQPSSGDTNTYFQFQVTFTDPENDPPDTDSVKLVLDSTEYIMTTTDTDYTDGSVFVYPAAGGIQLSEGSHPYYFEAKQDGQHVQGSPTGTPTLNVSQPSAGQVTVQLSPNPVEVFQATTVTATVKDSSNNPLPGVTVDFSQNGFPGVMSPTSDITDGSGQATSTFTPNASGSALISAQVSGGASGSSYLTVNPGTITFELSFSPGSGGGNAYDFQAKLLNNGTPWQGENVTLTLSPGSMAYFNRTSTSTFATTTNAGGYAQDGGSSVVDITTTDYGLLTITAEHDATGAISSITTNIQEGSGTTFEAFKDLGYSGIDVDWSGNGNLVAIKNSGENTYLIENVLTTPVLWRAVYTNCNEGRGVVFSDDSNKMFVTGNAGADELAVLTLNYPSGSPSVTASINDHGSTENRACDWGGSRIVTGRTSDAELEVYNTSLGSVCGIDMTDDVTAVAFDQTNPSRFVFGDWDGIIKAANTSCGALWNANIGSGQVTSAAWRGSNVVVGDNSGVIHRYNDSGGSHTTYTHGSGWVTATEFSPDGQWLATCGGGGIKIWSTSSWSVAYTGPSATCVAWDPTSTYLVDNNGKLYAPFNQTPPTIIISFPPDGYETYAATVEVSGTITGPLGISSATITVNGNPPETLVLDPSGDFSHTVSLDIGPNPIRIDASGGGKNSSAEITVTRLTDTTGPVISSVSVVPTQGEIGTVFNISAYVVDALSAVDAGTVICHVQLPDESDIAAPQMYDDGTHGDVTPGDSTYTCEWDSNSATESTYMVDITASDVPGNPSEAENAGTVTAYDLPFFGTPIVDPISPTDANNVTITIDITDPAGISSKILWYQHLANPGWVPVAMSGSGPSYSGTIPPMDDGTVEYKIEATDGLGHTGVSATYDYGVTDSTPPVAWGWSRTPSDITTVTTGPVHVSVEVTDVGGSGLAGDPQIDYRLSNGSFDGWESMSSAGGSTWTFDIPDLGWAGSEGLYLEYKVRAVDNRSNELVTPVQTELIDEVATYLVITGSATQAAGTAQTITITAYYDSCDVAVSYDGIKSLTFSGASSGGTYVPTVNDVNFGEPTSISFTNGVATASMVLYVAEIAEIEVTDGVINSYGSPDYDLDVTVTAQATADRLSFTTQPGNGIAGEPLSPQPVVEIQDMYSNRVTSANTTEVTLAIGDNPCGGTLSGTTTVTSAGGIASFTDLSIDVIGADYTLVASATGLDAGTSEPFNIFPIESIIYVDHNATAGTNNGASWIDAFLYLQDALNFAEFSSGGINEIRVAEGVYTPDTNSADPNGSGDRTATFQLISGVAIKGGYAGFGEQDPNLLDVELHETILSGDLNGDDADVNDPCDLLTEPTRGENSYHVVTGSGADPNAILEGFTISGGNANGSDEHEFGGGMYIVSGGLTVKSCTFARNSAIMRGGGVYINADNPTINDCFFTKNSVSYYGGGLSCDEANDVTVTNCRFNNNTAVFGGGIDCYSSDSTLTNCTFSNNTAEMEGGGVRHFQNSMVLKNCVFHHNVAEWGGGLSTFSTNGDLTMTNCTVSDNTATDAGGGIIDWTDTAKLKNCVLWGNSDTNTGTGELAQIFLAITEATIDYSSVQGWTGALGGFGNSGDDPCFADASDNDYHLRSQAGRWDPNVQTWVFDSMTTSCIDAGDPDSSWTEELWPHGRRINMGAYGGTPEASMSLSDVDNVANLNNDLYYSVDFSDLRIFCSKWCSDEILIAEDLNRDGVVNFRDYAIFAVNWETRLTRLCSFSLDTDPSWTTEGEWAFGQPTGGGGADGVPDPNTGYTGSNVYGYNLSGDYTNNLSETHLTSTVIDCTGFYDIRLIFWRWLGVEQPLYDHAYVQVSNNGIDWVTVWENTTEVADTDWQLMDVDISAIADNQSTVYLRWTMGSTDGGWISCGWNIDDIELWGTKFTRLHSFYLDTDPGWTTEGEWAFGQPSGGGGEYGGPDPNTGHTGSNVYGYNLSGDYSNYLPETHLTSTVIDCTGFYDMHLTFWRWLGVEQPLYDHAYVRVSNNGIDWVTVWENSSEVADTEWKLIDLDISAIADNRSTVYLRWTMGSTDEGWTYCGWNIDDIELWGNPM